MPSDGDGSRTIGLTKAISEAGGCKVLSELGFDSLCLFRSDGVCTPTSLVAERNGKCADSTGKCEKDCEPHTALGGTHEREWCDEF